MPSPVGFPRVPSGGGEGHGQSATHIPIPDSPTFPSSPAGPRLDLFLLTFTHRPWA